MGRAEGKWDGGVRQVQRQGWDEKLRILFFWNALRFTHEMLKINKLIEQKVRINFNVLLRCLFYFCKQNFQ